MSVDALPPSAPETAGESAHRRRLVAIALICAAFLCFSLLDTTAKWLSTRIGVIETTWVRYITSFFFVSLLINPWRNPRIAETRRPGLQAFRSHAQRGATVLNFVALKYLQLTETVTIVFMQPMLVALLAGPILGEWVGPRRLIAIGVGFLGVILVTKPGMGGIHWAAAFSFAGVGAYVCYAILTRMLADADPPETTMFYSAAAGILCLSPVVPFTWYAVPDFKMLLLMLLTGFWGALGHWLLILANRHAPASILAPFLYTQIIWMSGLGYLVFGDIPDRWTVLGGGIVTLSGLYLLHRERVTKKPG